MGQLPAPAGEGCSGGVKGREGVAEGLQLRAAVRSWGGPGEAFWALAGGLTTTGGSRHVLAAQEPRVLLLRISGMRFSVPRGVNDELDDSWEKTFQPYSQASPPWF